VLAGTILIFKNSNVT